MNRTYVYNAHQELCRSVEPETGATLMGYDPAGNLAWSAAGLPAATACHATGLTPAIGARRVDRTYDARNRLKTLSFPLAAPGTGNGDQAWSYYADGKPQQISTWNIGAEGADPKETRNLYTYFKRGLPKTELIAVPAWYTFSVEHGYNANGQETSLTYPSGHTVTRTLDALGQPTAISGGGTTYASGITYHPNGAVAGFAYGNNIIHAMTQNDRQLPDTVSSIHGGSQFLHDQYDFDGHGNVLAITDVRPGKAGRRSRTMEYDGLDRLTRVTSPMYGAVGAHYAYNVLDDLVQVNIGGTKGRNHHYCYNAQRQLAEIRSGSCGGAVVTRLDFDDQGNLELRREGPDPNVPGQGYRFDFGNRLREVDGIERYRYDGHGRRVLAMQFVQGTVLSQYGLDGKLLYQKSDRTLLQTDHVYLGNTLIAIHERPASGTGATVVKYQHTDALGSPVVVTRQNRDIVEETEYEPYGQVLNRPMHDGPGYTGHVEDAATGLVQMQQRYYDPGIGRFLSVDPVTANPANGSNFNRYKYAANNPYRFTDPDGRMDKETRRELAADRRSMMAHPSLQGSVRTIGGMPSSRTSSSGQGSQRPLANSVTDLARNVGGAIADRTDLTVSASGAFGSGAEFEASRPLTGRELTLSGDMAIGAGAGLFGGAEINLATFTLPSAVDSFVNLKSGALDVRVGAVGAIGTSLEVDVGGQIRWNIFLGTGLGGHGIVKMPVTLGVEKTFNEDP